MTNETTGEHDDDARQWNFRDIRGTAFTVNPSSQLHAAIFGRREALIVSLDDGQIQKRFSRSGKWDCTCAEWCPHSGKDSLIATASNNKLVSSVHIYDTTPREPIEYSEQACGDARGNCLKRSLLYRQTELFT